MDEIYACALVTIVAASGIDANAGLSRFSSGSLKADSLVEVNSTRGSITVVAARVGLDVALSRTTWATRGWTYQEYVLSKNVVFFTEDEVYFTRPQETEREAFFVSRDISETVQSGDPRAGPSRRMMSIQGIMSGALPQEDPFQHYRRAVQEFTLRHLSHPGDRLDAIAGVLSRLEERLPDKSEKWPYVCIGLQMTDISRFLYWDFAAVSLENTHRVSRTATDEYYLPSWSWAGWSSAVDFDEFENYNPERLHITVKAMDAFNIQCILHDGKWPGEAWPFTPKVHPNPAKTVLHLWARSLSVSAIDPNGSYCSVYFKDGRHETVQMRWPRWQLLRHGHENMESYKVIVLPFGSEHPLARLIISC